MFQAKLRVSLLSFNRGINAIKTILNDYLYYLSYLYMYVLEQYFEIFSSFITNTLILIDS